jgi:putative endonuclease
MEDKYYVYIIRSESLQKYYAGYTSDLNDRMLRHLRGANKFTGKANDWKIVTYFEASTKSEALKLENKIKKRGIKRFLQDINVL